MASLQPEACFLFIRRIITKLLPCPRTASPITESQGVPSGGRYRLRFYTLGIDRSGRLKMPNGNEIKDTSRDWIYQTTCWLQRADYGHLTAGGFRRLSKEAKSAKGACTCMSYRYYDVRGIASRALECLTYYRPHAFPGAPADRRLSFFGALPARPRPSPCCTEGPGVATLRRIYRGAREATASARRLHKRIAQVLRSPFRRRFAQEHTAANRSSG